MFQCPFVTCPGQRWIERKGAARFCLFVCLFFCCCSTWQNKLITEHLVPSCQPEPEMIPGFFFFLFLVFVFTKIISLLFIYLFIYFFIYFFIKIMYIFSGMYRNVPCSRFYWRPHKSGFFFSFLFVFLFVSNLSVIIVSFRYKRV